MNVFSELTVLRALASDPLIRTFGEEGCRAEFLHLLFERGAERGFAAYLANAVLTDENAFSRTCARGETPSRWLKSAFCKDLGLLAEQIGRGDDGSFHMGEAPLPVGDFGKDCAERLEEYYQNNGYGRFLAHVAFRYHRKLVPIQSPSAVSLSDLKEYESEQTAIRDNFESFVHGLPYSDMLLYGDRGTGKSSTVHAMVNRFASKRLRLVEIAGEDILSLPRLKTMLAEIPMRFVVFIDDFSLSGTDGRLSALKSALQGSMEGHAGNVMIVATSNLRHIVNETLDARTQSVHRNDSEQELLSLSDRFGMAVLFPAPDQQTYRAIVRALANDFALRTPVRTLEELAERWALVKGGRSPRRARQFIDYVRACEAKHIPIDV